MTHNEYKKMKAKLDALDDIYDDLPDGAYFAAMAENGITTDDMAEMAEHEAIHNLDDEDRRFSTE